jgi:hypothetical protein
MTLHKRNELQRAQWDAYLARQDTSVVERVLRSPVTLVLCLIGIGACAVGTVVLLLRG